MLNLVRQFFRDREKVRLDKKYSCLSNEIIADFQDHLNNEFNEAWNGFTAKWDNSIPADYLSSSSINRRYKTTLWWGTDTEQNYDKGGNKRYSKKDITYTVNDNLFREYNRWGGEKIVACFGCSNTIGIGLPDEQTWPYILNQHIGNQEYTCYNFGVNGGSADTISRLVRTYLNTAKPHTIICLFPDMFRMEYINVERKRILNFSPAIPYFSKQYTPECTIIKAFTNEYFAFFNLIKNINYIESMCSSRGIKFIWHTWSKPILEMDPNTVKRFTSTQLLTENNKMIDPFTAVRWEDDLARDGIHFGAHYNKAIAQAFAKRL
jgi:lysophospholipase L1-like esterase